VTHGESLYLNFLTARARGGATGFRTADGATPLNPPACALLGDALRAGAANTGTGLGAFLFTGDVGAGLFGAGENLRNLAPGFVGKGLKGIGFFLMGLIGLKKIGFFFFGLLGITLGSGVTAPPPDFLLPNVPEGTASLRSPNSSLFVNVLLMIPYSFHPSQPQRAIVNRLHT
jgi:hypothetical protein